MLASYRWFVSRFLVAVLAMWIVLNVFSWRDGGSSARVRTPAKIMLWNAMFDRPDYYFGLGDLAFLEQGCTYSECTLERNDGKRPLSEYDAVVFHGPEFNPKMFNATGRRQEQLFVYLSMESPLNRPIGGDMDDFFNMTMTYRIDSDLPLPYFYFQDEAGNMVAPSANPKWKCPIVDTSEYLKIYARKTKPAAWFSSNCNSHSKREWLVRELQKYLNVDVYGGCGPLKCPRSSENQCFEMLERDYFFYLSFENSLCLDYITEKAANAYRHNTIPVVFSGANLTHHLPPNSYLDASSMNAKQLAEKMQQLMNDPTAYSKYFWWKGDYVPTLGPLYSVPSFCGLCEALHTNRKNDNKHISLHSWWHGDRDQPVCKNN